MMELKICLYDYGDIVEDIITGYRGKVTAYSFYYGHDSAMYRVEGKDDTGRPVEEWINAERLRHREELPWREL